MLLISADARQSDTNLSPVIVGGGKLVGIWRIWSGGSWPHLVTATNWKDPSTYVFVNCSATPGAGKSCLFPELHSTGTEVSDRPYVPVPSMLQLHLHAVQRLGGHSSHIWWAAVLKRALPCYVRRMVRCCDALM